MTKGKKWLALGSALVGLVASISFGVMFEETQRVEAKADYNVVEQQEIAYTYNEVAAEDIADMLISDGIVGGTGVESAFTFAIGDTVEAVDNIVHTPGSGYWDWDKTRKELNVNFKMQFADWNGGWFGFRMSDGMTELRIYNDKIVLSGDGGAKGVQEFASVLTDGLYLVNMTYQFRKTDDTVNGSRLTVTIDDVAYVIESDWYARTSGNPLRLWNATGTGVYIETARIKGLTYSEVISEDIADMLISNGVLGGAGSETAFAFGTGDTVSAEDNRIHTPGSDYLDWDLNKKELGVNFKMQFANWNGGWIGFKMSDGMTELRIYNDKIEVIGNGAVKGTQAFASTLTEGLHLVNMIYQFRKVHDTVNGSRLTVMIDGVAYVVESDWYSTGGGNAFILWNATGTGVYIETSKPRGVTYSDVEEKDITKWYIIDETKRNEGWEYHAGLDNAFSFYMPQQVASGEHYIHDRADYWHHDVGSTTGYMTMKLDFTGWDTNGWFGLNFGSGQLRIYKDKIALHNETLFDRDDTRPALGEKAFGYTVSDGVHTVSLKYQTRFMDGVAVGSCFTAIIDGNEFVVDVDNLTSGGHVCALWNETGKAVTVQTAIQYEKEYSYDQPKDLSEWWIINNQLRNSGYEYNAGAENAFNFLFEESVGAGYHIFHDRADYWQHAISYSTGGMEFVMSFDGWNRANSFDSDWNWITEDGYFAIQLGGTQIRIYANRVEIYSGNGSEYLLQDQAEFGKRYSGMQDVTVLIRAIMYNGNKVATEGSVTIGSTTYIVESSFIPKATHSYLINETGADVKIYSQLKQKSTAQIQASFNSEEYYEREVAQANEIIENSIYNVKIASVTENIKTIVANALNQLDKLPKKVEVDAMVAANAAYANEVKASLATQKAALDQSMFTVAQWNRIEEISNEALNSFDTARNAKETDTIKNETVAQIQIVIEDATRLAFYKADITERLAIVESDSELATMLQAVLDKVVVADFAEDVEDDYLAVVLAMDGEGKAEEGENNDLTNDSEFEKMEGTDNISAGQGCSAVMENNIGMVVIFIFAVALILRKKKIMLD